MAAASDGGSVTSPVGQFHVQPLKRTRIALFSHQDADFDPPLDEQTCYVIADQSGGTGDQHAGPECRGSR